MKALFVGDIHNHQYIFNDIARLDKDYNFDEVVFVGDYVDDWETNNQISLKTLQKVTELKNSNPNKYFFCIGNHELSYLGYPCSGHNFEDDELLRLHLIENADVFSYYHTIKLGDNEYYCSHAGFLNAYLTEELGQYGEWQNVLSEMNTSILKYLKQILPCSFLRGGRYEYGSFVWADKKEHLIAYGEPLIPYQIIGHSPVQTIFNIHNDFDDLWFIDTHSTYKDGEPFGDKSYLMWNENKFEIVY